MRVKVELSIDFDAEAWDNEYGPNPDSGESRAQMLRRDVREYVLNMVQHSYAFDSGAIPSRVDLRQ